MNNNINRRQFIKKSAIGILGAGAILTTGTIMVSTPDMGLADPYPELPDRKPDIPPYNKKVLFFNEHQYALVATLAALIVPTDDDPGDTETGVADYIDTLIARSEKKQTIYTKGLKWLDEFSLARYGSSKDYLNLSLKEQIDLLRLIDETQSMYYRSVSDFWQRVDRKIDQIWSDMFGVGRNSKFFKIIRQDVLNGYYSHPASWKGVGYFGPPQPNGYPDFASPPSPANYTGTIRPIDNISCKICHKDGKHPRGGFIDHTCTTCHRPHSPWTYDKDSFHLEDHIGLLFPNSDREEWR